MRDIQFRPAQRTCFCRGCDKEIAPNTEKIITFYSFRNRGQHIHICVPCVESFSALIAEEKLSPPKETSQPPEPVPDLESDINPNVSSQQAWDKIIEFCKKK